MNIRLSLAETVPSWVLMIYAKAYCKNLTHWRYCNVALSHRYVMIFFKLGLTIADAVSRIPETMAAVAAGILVVECTGTRLNWGGKHDHAIKRKHFLCNWPFVRENHRSTMDSPHKGQWRRALMFSLMCAWTKDWRNSEVTVTADAVMSIWRHCNDVTVMELHLNPCLAEFFWEKNRWLTARLQYLQCVSNEDTVILHKATEIKMYSNFLLSFNTEEVKVVEIIACDRQGSVYPVQSIIWSRKAWRHKDPGHQWN